MATKTRTYSSNRRAAQAAQTRVDVVAAAVDCFRANGWSGTTMNAVAEKAGVSVETVYAGFKNKKALLRAACEYAVVGDSDPVAYIDRPQTQLLREGTFESRARLGMHIQWTVHDRVAGVWMALVEAAASDPEIEEWRVAFEAARKSDISRSLEMIFEREIDEATLDLITALYSSEVFVQLRERGWSQEQYENEIYEATRLLIERPALPKQPRRSRS
jgi:AcrR family transcriptional regulator